MVDRSLRVAGGPRQKVAIVGTGIAGNVVANRLQRHHDISVFEANDYVGGHTNTIDHTVNGADLRLDTGFIVFNDRTYPKFIRMLDELGVEPQSTTMSFSVRSAGNGLEYNGSSLNGLFAQRRNLLRPSFHRMIRDILRFNRESVSLLWENSSALTLAEYLARNRYSREFVQHYLIPMGAAIWSSDPVAIQKIPAAFFIRFFHNHGLLALKDRPVWKVIRGGSRAYVERLVASHRDRIRLGVAVRSVVRTGRKVNIRCSDGTAESFDAVFIATHSDQALRMLGDASSDERNILGAIPYQKNDAVLHTDPSLMPVKRRAWAAWNYHIPQQSGRVASVTYHLNQLQRLPGKENYFVTLNRSEEIRPDLVIRRIAYEHPVFNVESVAAQARQGEINGVNRTWYCGAYWRNGFHEDGVVSALAALADFERRNAHAQLHLQRAG